LATWLNIAVIREELLTADQQISRGQGAFDPYIWQYGFLNMKTTIELPDELLIQAKQFAAGQRTTMRALIERGLRHELKNAGPSKKKKRPAIRWVTVPGGPPKAAGSLIRKSR